MLKFTLVLLAGTLIILPGLLMRLDKAPAIDHFGGYIAGCAALWASIAATWKASHEWDAWRRRKVSEHESEVAAKAIVRALALLHVMEVFAPQRAIESDPTAERLTSDEIVAMIRARNIQIESETRAFQVAWYEAEAYLGNEAVARLRAFEKVVQTIKSRWATYVIVGRIQVEPDPVSFKRALCALEDEHARLEEAAEMLRVSLRAHTLGHREPSGTARSA
ncbi:MAG: hypothetical protein OXR73_25355 [Myxococcales bacterium]|nr:hypothetical protein [Myxococcales bacterium]